MANLNCDACPILLVSLLIFTLLVIRAGRVSTLLSTLPRHTASAQRRFLASLGGNFETLGRQFLNVVFAKGKVIVCHTNAADVGHDVDQDRFLWCIRA